MNKEIQIDKSLINNGRENMLYHPCYITWSVCYDCLKNYFDQLAVSQYCFLDSHLDVIIKEIMTSLKEEKLNA